MKRIVKFSSVLMLGALVAGTIPNQGSAHGWGGGGWGGGWHGGGWGGRGWGFGVGLGYGFAPFLAAPYYYAPPVYYAPPAYYGPPPSYYYAPPATPIAGTPAAAPPSSAAASDQSCNAGLYICPMEIPVPAGTRCYCPGNDGNRVYGSAQ